MTTRSFCVFAWYFGKCHCPRIRSPLPRCGGAKIEWELSVSKDIMRGLRTAGLTTELSGRHCDLDQVFWHTIRPVNDPFWSQHRPGDRWNCKCSLEATDAPVTEIPRTGREIAESAQAGLENNPGTDGRIFSETHPYIAEAYPGAKEAVERIVNMSETKIARLSAKHLQGKSLSHPNFPHTIQISGNSIKEWTNQPHMHYAEKNAMLLTIFQWFPETEYLDVADGYAKNPRAKSHVFEVTIEGDKSWIIVREYDSGEFILHSISDNPEIKNYIK